MNQPIKPGKLINDHYLVKLILGQGRFNRTYLVEDTHRFNEPCVVKEFAPQIEDSIIREKTAEIFHRQAEILYNLYHPQLANFREIFRASQENPDSIFLVQDYVEGQTYQDLLNLRRSRGKFFTEAEIRALLKQLLPILQYLHEQGIIHRDICPKNIIQREFDSLPVLIDFSSVKLLESTSPQEPSTKTINDQPKTSWILSQLGKMTYGSKGQESLEWVSIDGDLYGLGVTAVVLLTGKEISLLTDTQQTLTEILHEHSISPELTKILLKMLAQPTEPHFSSAQEILDDLSRDDFTDSANIGRKNRRNTRETSVNPSKSTSVNSIAQNPDMAVVSPPSQKVFWGCLGKLSLFLLLVGTSGLMGWFAGKTWLVKMLQPTAINSTNSDILTSNNGSTGTTPPTEEGNKTKELVTRRRELGIDRLFFDQLVDQLLAIQETNPENKTDSKEKAREKAAHDLLDKLDRLSPDALGELGRYGIEQRSEWARRVNQLHLSSRALSNLVNIRFLKDFPELENQNFMDQPLGQVWYAIAFDTVKSLEAKQNYELLTKDATQTTQQVMGKLESGEGKAYSISLPASKPMEIKLQASPDALLTIYSPTGQEILLDNSRTHQWSGILPESGYYEILVTSKAKEAFDYQLTLSVW
ncbi:MAG: protein kinase [Snowella sp.]|nr:protein kinase [Snowella sp.]